MRLAECRTASASRSLECEISPCRDHPNFLEPFVKRNINPGKPHIKASATHNPLAWIANQTSSCHLGHDTQDLTLDGSQREKNEKVSAELGKSASWKPNSEAT